MAGRRAVKAVLIDLSGTLHVEDTAVAGAQEALSRWGWGWGSHEETTVSVVHFLF